MKYVVGMGDFLASFSPQGFLRFRQANSFDVTYTGAEANVLVSLSNFGVPTQMMTKLPTHAVADSAIDTLRGFGVGTAYIARGGERMGVLFLEKGASQRPSKVIYDRAHSAVCDACTADFEFDRIFEGAQWFHFTGITAALSEKTAKLCLEACKKAKEYGVTVSCDLNYRKNLWTTEQAKKVMTELLNYVDVLIANEEDVEKVLGIRPEGTDVERAQLNQKGYEEVAKQLTETYGLKAVATTLRESISASENGWSSLLYTNGKTYLSKRYQIHIVNRVGGGDSFSAGLIFGMLQGYEPQQTVEFATAASCLKHTIEYDYNLVGEDEVWALVHGGGSGRVQR